MADSTGLSSQAISFSPLDRGADRGWLSQQGEAGGHSPFDGRGSPEYHRLLNMFSLSTFF